MAQRAMAENTNARRKLISIQNILNNKISQYFKTLKYQSLKIKISNKSLKKVIFC
jgi:hypothetical protein